MKSRPLLTRLMEKVLVDPSGCWIFTGSTTPKGYGYIARTRGPTTSAHRAAYELFVGEIPAGLELDHLCRVRNCVNPAHLEPVSHAVNVARSVRQPKTHCPHGHPLTADNLRFNRCGSRFCRLCKNAATARSAARRRERRAG